MQHFTTKPLLAPMRRCWVICQEGRAVSTQQQSCAVLALPWTGSGNAARFQFPPKMAPEKRTAGLSRRRGSKLQLASFTAAQGRGRKLHTRFRAKPCTIRSIATYTRYMRTYIHTCMHACMHTYIHTYIHTNYTYVQTYTFTF